MFFIKEIKRRHFYKAMYPDFVAASPKGLVPAVAEGDDKVWESLHVVQYASDFVFGLSFSANPCDKIGGK